MKTIQATFLLLFATVALALAGTSARNCLFEVIGHSSSRFHAGWLDCPLGPASQADSKRWKASRSGTSQTRL